MHATSYAVVSNPAHLFPLNLLPVPVHKDVSSVVYPTNPVLTFGVLPDGADQTRGRELGSVKLSILFDPSTSGGFVDFTVTAYPF